MTKYFQVITDHPIAADSVDHLVPGGTANDDSRNSKFNDRLSLWTEGRHLAVLDCGCAGGGFVHDMILAGHDAMGLEGSDYSLIRKRAQWATIPESLFTADIGMPFRIETKPEGTLASFDIITAWEVMEHIPEARLPQFINNILQHLAEDGAWIMSVSTQLGIHHCTVHDREWWLRLFSEHGLVNDDVAVRHFGDDWIRGPQQNAPESFHLILKRRKV